LTFEVLAETVAKDSSVVGGLLPWDGLNGNFEDGRADGCVGAAEVERGVSPKEGLEPVPDAGDAVPLVLGQKADAAVGDLKA
jgi:hypothetical protein